MNLDRDIVQKHRQVYDYSCTPMGAELVLKLIKRVPEDYFELQEATKNNPVTFADLDGRKIHDITFHMQFSVKHGRNFPPEKIAKLFETIDAELDAGRYVIISIANDPKNEAKGWHDFVIYDHAEKGEYRAVSKAFRPHGDFDHPEATWDRSDIRKMVEEMTGTDILTYDPIP